MTIRLTWLLIPWLGWTALSFRVRASTERWLQRSVFLDEAGHFRMIWGNDDMENIIISLEVETLGYVALGFSRYGSMVDSDFVIGWVEDGQVYLQDRYAENNRMPEMDQQQDWELISGSENVTHTTLVFKRKWNTCDSQDFAFEYDNTIRVIHAYTHEDPASDIHIPVHSRGWRSIMLLQPENTRATDVQYWDVVTNEFIVTPEYDTLYWCKLFKTPELEQKHHVTTMDPLILGENHVPYIHHIVVFECNKPDPSDYDRYLNEDGYNCADPNAPKFTRECDGYYTLWTKGGEGIVLPEHIGFLLESNKYMMLQVHYDNVNRQTSEPGIAGIRIHHTPHLRQNEGAMFLVGNAVFRSVAAPPGVQNFVVAAHTNPDCTGPSLPSEGINMESATLHTHLLGRKMKLRHFRNSIELPPLANNKNYDHEYQQPTIFREEINMLPGDQITLECSYDSTGRNATTFGGNSTREEMCSAFIVHYPRFVGIEGSYGSLTLAPERLTTHLLGLDKLRRLTANLDDYSSTFSDFMTDYNWNKTAIRWFEEKTRFADQITYCHRGTGDLFTVTTTIAYPKGLKEYVEPSYCPAQVGKTTFNSRG